MPEALEALITKATQPAPDARFADVLALRDALSHLTDDGHLRPVEVPRARWPAVAASVLATAIVASGSWWYFTPPVVVEKAPVSVLIADFENRTGDPVFDGVVEQALGLGMESASFITAYPRRDALRVAAAIKPGAKLDEPTARLVALREGVSMVIVGAVEASGTGFLISTRALQGGDEAGTEVYALSEEAESRDDVLNAVGRLAGDVREALGDTAVSSGSPTANETFTAASLEAARAYAKAQELQVAGSVEEAIEQYKATLVLDPDLGRAYSGLAAQYSNLARTADADANYQQALARIDRMTDREKFRTRGSYYLFARKPDLAAEEFTALVKAFPADTSGLSNLALASFYQRDMAQALEQGRRAAAIFPNNVLRRSNVALYAMYAGQFEDAITESDAVHQLNPAHLKAFVARALSLLALDRSGDAGATYDAARGDESGRRLVCRVRARGHRALSWPVRRGGHAARGRHHGRPGAREHHGRGRQAGGPRRSAAGAGRRGGGRARSRGGRRDERLRRHPLRRRAGAGGSRPDSAGGTARWRPGHAARTRPAGLRAARARRTGPGAQGRAQGRGLRARGAEAVGHLAGTRHSGSRLPGRERLPEAYSEFEAALKRRGEATALYLDDVPTYRHVVPVYYLMGLAQDGLRSPAAKASFATYVALRTSGTPHPVLDDARRRATAK